jgi:hypothetical protein
MILMALKHYWQDVVAQQDVLSNFIYEGNRSPLYLSILHSLWMGVFLKCWNRHKEKKLLKFPYNRGSLDVEVLFEESVPQFHRGLEDIGGTDDQ